MALMTATRIACPLTVRDVPAARMAANQAHQAGADLIELRLDLCAAAGADPQELVRSIPDLGLPVIATCRHRGEGGAWNGEESARLALIQQAEAHGAAWVDWELAFLDRLDGWRPQRAGLILSHHDFEGQGSDLEALVIRMYAAGAQCAKLAVTPPDAAALAPLADLCSRYGLWTGRNDARSIVALGMGEVGLPSRVLAGAWGAWCTFGRLEDGDPGSAPGQPTVAELASLYRVGRQGSDTRIFGLAGKPVGHSLSPLIYNTAFAHLDLDAVHAPFLVHDAPAFWQACGGWIDGLSLTVPHKTALLDQLDEIEPLAARLGIINTVWRDQSTRAIGANTEAPAAVECLEQALGPLARKRILVLGAGGAGRGIAFALAAAGAEVAIANRTAARSATLAGEIGALALTGEEARAWPWEALVNATSVGLGTEESPWPADRLRPGAVVFDTVYHPLQTRLLREACEAGCIPLCGLALLISQAVEQFRRWTGQEPPRALMQRRCLERLGLPQGGCGCLHLSSE